jgi:hypothetical protein
MSRLLCGIALLCAAATAGAQVGRAPDLPMGAGTAPDIRSKNADPAAVLYAGALVSDVLKSLTSKGFQIKWKPEQVLPTMTLLEKPKATRIDNLLNEILAPWGMRADHNLMDGGYLVKTIKKKQPKD